MNKSDLIAAVAAKTGDTKKNAEASINALIDVIAESLKDGEKIQVVGFGSFEVRERAPVFKAGKALKDAVNG